MTIRKPMKKLYWLADVYQDKYLESTKENGDFPQIHPIVENYARHCLKNGMKNGYMEDNI